MTHRNEHNTPEARERAKARVRRLTRAAVIAAMGATGLIGVLVAKERPGASSAETVTQTNPTTTTSTTTTTTTASGSHRTSSTTTPTTSTPTTTTTQPVVTSGGTSR
jgi:hypothetical protein